MQFLLKIELISIAPWEWNDEMLKIITPKLGEKETYQPASATLTIYSFFGFVF